MKLFQRASDGSIILYTRHPKLSPTWHWSVSLERRNGNRFYIPPAAKKGQWHCTFNLFKWALIISKQDFHK